MIHTIHHFLFTGGIVSGKFLRVGEIRSLVPSEVHVMALTATATKGLREEVQRILGMKEPVVVVKSPAKSNIMYIIHTEESLDKAFTPMFKQLQKDRKEFPQTIIYCQRFSDCGYLYTMFRDFLGPTFTEPTDAPDLPQFRV